MKKTILLAIVSLCLLQVNTFAQKARAGIFAGYSQSNWHGKTGGVTDKGKTMSGYTFGMLVDVPIKKSNFSFQPTGQYAQKGWIVSKTNSTKNYVALHYAEALFNFVYNWKGSAGHVFVGLGPTLGLPLPSKKVVKTDVSKNETSLVFGKEAIADYKSLDYGAHIMGGYQFRKGCFISLGYTFGIRNIHPGEDPVDEIRNGCLALKLGFIVNNK